MILLDTSVLSELMAPEPDERVFAFVDARLRATLFTASVVEAEILAGLAMLPAGRRRTALEEEARRLFDEEFGGRVLPFDRDAAVCHAAIVAERWAAGRPLEGFDGLVAAIARAAGALIATRSVSDFEDCGVALVDPWAAA